MKGIWTLYRLTTEGREKLTEIEAEDDCSGDELYEHLLPYLPDNASLDDYEFDGDSEYVAVLGKTATRGDFGYEFKPYKEE